MAKKKGKKKHVSARRIMQQIRKTTAAVEALAEVSTPAEARRLAKKIKKLHKLETDTKKICRVLAI